MTMFLLKSCVVVAILVQCEGWGSSGGGRVLLDDVKVLTLYAGQQTAGRRSAPVPQLSCVGGSGHGRFTPQVVQCHNKGSDGYSTQWECKADMDNEFRFGRVEVTCEGYDYPDDPYILQGSCGLEYTLEFTKEGYEKQNARNQYHTDYSYNKHTPYSDVPQKHGTFGSVVFLLVVCVVIYVIYQTCLRSPNRAADDMRRDTGPPPPGFRQDYMPGGGNTGYSSSSSYGGYGGTHGTGGAGMGGGGFWSGAATGGLLGYMFGSRNNRAGYHTGYQHQSPGWGQSRGFFGSGSSSMSAPRSSGFSVGSSGTRTASGFGGTKRR